jgi:hypothetical protein
VALALEDDIFCSAKDILYKVHSAWPSGQPPTISPKKRGRAEQNHYTSEGGDHELQMEVDSDEESVLFELGPDAIGARKRPMKPLRQSRRVFTETRSLPAGALRFSGTSRPLYSDKLDDDWSAELSGVGKKF